MCLLEILSSHFALRSTRARHNFFLTCQAPKSPPLECDPTGEFQVSTESGRVANASLMSSYLIISARLDNCDLFCFLGALCMSSSSTLNCPAAVVSTSESDIACVSSMLVLRFFDCLVVLVFVGPAQVTTLLDIFPEVPIS